MRSWRNAAWCTLALGVLVTLAALVHAGGLRWASVPFGLWALLPFLVLGALVWRAATAAAGLVLTLGCLTASTLGAVAYYQGFVTQVDPQSGLLLVFVPLYQLGIAAVVVVAVSVIGRGRDSA